MNQYNTLDYNKLRDEKTKEECSLYVFKLFFLFAVELLRRQKVLEYPSFKLFDVEKADDREITIYKSFDDEKWTSTAPKKMQYNDFIGAFWES